MAARIAGLYASWDDAVSTAVFSGLKTLGFDELQPGKPSPLTRDLPWVRSPTPAVTTITAYLLIIVASVAYQKATNKKPYAKDPLWLRILVQAHNGILVRACVVGSSLFTTHTQIALSTYMCCSAAYCAVSYGYRLWGNAYKPTQSMLAHTVWVFYMSKFYEFLDTVRGTWLRVDVACITQLPLPDHHGAQGQAQPGELPARLPPHNHLRRVVGHHVCGTRGRRYVRLLC